MYMCTYIYTIWFTHSMLVYVYHIYGILLTKKSSYNFKNNNILY